MGIHVECPHGHSFKVKDKYAGKRGLCPHCKDQVVVKVPELLKDDQTDEVYRRAVIEEHRAEHAAPPVPAADTSSSIFDDQPQARGSGTSGSLLGSSVISHHKKCKCGAKSPMWYAKCKACGEFFEGS